MADIAPGHDRGTSRSRVTDRFVPPSLLVGLLLSSLLLIAPGVRADALSELLAPDGGAPAEAGAGGTIDAESSATTDGGIARRLRGIYAELEALDGIAVEVASGIVTLEGTADSTRGAQRAVAIAAQVVGVVDVVDEIAIDANVGRRLQATLDRLIAAFLSTFAAFPVLILALVIVGVFWWAARRVAQWKRPFAAVAPNGFIADLLGGLARIAIVALGVFLALSLLDATSIIGTVLGAAGIVGLAVGFAVRDTVENWIASVLLSLRTPFLARDFVRIGEHEGAVARLTSRATILISPDGNHIRIPNSTVYKSVVVNFSRNPERRFEFSVGVDVEHELNEARETALDAVNEVPGVLDSPPASVIVEDLGDSNVTLTVMAWSDQRRSDIRKVRSEAIRFVKRAFDAGGIVMPEPIYRVNLGRRDGALEPLVGMGGGLGGREIGSSHAASDDSAGKADEATGYRAGALPIERFKARDAADTSPDVDVAATLEREIHEGRRAGGAENLLDGAAPRE